RFRDPVVRLERQKLSQLARQANVKRLSPALLTILGTMLEDMGDLGLALLEQGQRRYPGDFWLNFELANALNKRARWDEAIGYYRAALAVRPQTGAVYNNLGNALYAKQDLDGAIASFHKAIALDPNDPTAYTGLGVALEAKRDVEGAIGQFKQALAIEP